MARPRVFISSTYYDLQSVRDDLERFIASFGYEPIRHETGSIPYTKEAPLEESAYREVTLSDIIVCIIGGRYGTTSTTREGSITQNELTEALEKGIQVYVFVEQNVNTEYSNYELNKDNKKTKYKYVDDIAVYGFLEKIFALPQNNPITPFSTSADICDFLKAQWAGLFQRFLGEERRETEIKVLREMKNIAGTLQQLVKYLTEERKSKDDAIKSILLTNHPAFRAFAETLAVKYRVFFTNRDELNVWLRARSYKPVDAEHLDEDSVAEWYEKNSDILLKLTMEIFDEDGKLLVISDEEWDNEWLKQIVPPLGDDDIPF